MDYDEDVDVPCRGCVRLTELVTKIRQECDAARAEVEALSRQRDRDYEIAIEERDSALDDLITARAEVERYKRMYEERHAAGVESRSKVRTLEAEVERLQNKLSKDSQNFQIECQQAEIALLRERDERLRGALSRIVEGDEICDDCDAAADLLLCGSCELGLTTSGMVAIARTALGEENNGKVP